MSCEEDFALALRLQKQFENEVKRPQPKKVLSPSNNATGICKNISEKKASVVDPSWEYIDPTPDIHALFIQFDNRFFWGKLKQVEVRWSPRMTSCAGVCCYEGRGGFCSIRLSVPLLKLRPRKDLVETLLHEMIHAYLFVTHNNRDRDGHGPEFHKHMDRINKDAGTKITVYHSFHDEVKLYQQHWWRCNGPCQKRPPFFGMVKRSMNRAPGPYDFWWKDHEATCGGSYIKVKEPPGFSEKNAKQGNKKGSQTECKKGDIRNFFNGNNAPRKGPALPVKGNGMNNVFGFSDLRSSGSTCEKHRNGDNGLPKIEPVFHVKGNKGNNVVGFSDLSGSRNIREDTRNIPTSKGNVLGSKAIGNTDKRNKKNVPTQKPVDGVSKVNENSSGTISRTPVDNTAQNGLFSGKTGNRGKGVGGMLANKGGGTLVVTTKGNKDKDKVAVTNEAHTNFIPFSGAGHKLGMSETRADVAMTSGGQLHTSRLLNHNSCPKKGPSHKSRLLNDDSPEKGPLQIFSFINGDSSPEKETALKRHSSGSTRIDKKKSKNDSVVDLTVKNIEYDIELVNCPVCGNQVTESEINRHLDSCMDSTSSAAGQNERRVNEMGNNSAVVCPSCKNEVPESVIHTHLDICILNTPDSCDQESDKVKCPACNIDILQCKLNDHLNICLGSIFFNEDNQDQGSSEKSDEREGKYPCPCCAQLYEDTKMNSHLDQCLAGV